MGPFEDAAEAFERRNLKYAELVAEARQRGWQAHTRSVKIAVRGLVAKSITTIQLDFGFSRTVTRMSLKAVV